MRKWQLLGLIASFIAVMFLASCGLEPSSNGGFLRDVTPADQTGSGDVKLTSLNPAEASKGEIIEVIGQGFIDGIIAKFDDIEATVNFISATELKITIPDLGKEKDYDLTLTNSDGSWVTGKLIFSYTLTPTQQPIPELDPTPIPIPYCKISSDYLSAMPACP